MNYLIDSKWGKNLCFVPKNRFFNPNSSFFPNCRQFNLKSDPDYAKFGRDPFKKKLKLLRRKFKQYKNALFY